MIELTQDGRNELALALILLKDFKCGGKFDFEYNMTVITLAKELGVYAEFEDMLSKIPPMKIEPRYPEDGK